MYNILQYLDFRLEFDILIFQSSNNFPDSDVDSERFWTALLVTWKDIYLIKYIYYVKLYLKKLYKTTGKNIQYC